MAKNWLQICKLLTATAVITPEPALLFGAQIQHKESVFWGLQGGFRWPSCFKDFCFSFGFHIAGEAKQPFRCFFKLNVKVCKKLVTNL